MWGLYEIPPDGFNRSLIAIYSTRKKAEEEKEKRDEFDTNGYRYFVDMVRDEEISKMNLVSFY